MNERVDGMSVVKMEVKEVNECAVVERMCGG